MRVKAITLLSEFREQGCMLHSYLEDGYGALFKHCATVAAWAMLEYYLVEELIGAKLTHCIGGLTSDPIKRSGWVLALQKIHHGDLVGSMIYGETISFRQDFDKNRAVTAEYLLSQRVIDEQAPDQILKILRSNPFDALLLTTHNGMALEYGQQLQSNMIAEQITLPVIMGGVLNQKVEGQALPVPVVEELKSLGFFPGNSLPGITKLLAK